MQIIKGVVIFTIPLILIAILNYAAIQSALSDVEYWGGYVTKTEYFESWNEYISKQCSTTSCSGSGKNQQCTTTYYDCSYVEYHEEYWTMTNNNNEEFNINALKFNELVTRWNSKVFVNMHRNYYTQNGNCYRASFNNDFNSLEPTTTQHTFENRIQASNSIFSFKNISPEGLYPHSLIVNYQQDTLLGGGTPEEHLKLKRINALLGKEKQVVIYLILWKGQPIQKAFDQEQLVRRGAKNELYLNVGLDNTNKVTWSYVFSWSESELLKVELKNWPMENDFSVDKYLDFIQTEVQSKWTRKNFKDFNYIDVQPSFTWTVIISLLVLLITGGLSYGAIKLDNIDFNRRKYGRFKF